MTNQELTNKLEIAKATIEANNHLNKIIVVKLIRIIVAYEEKLNIQHSALEEIETNMQTLTSELDALTKDKNNKVPYLKVI